MSSEPELPDWLRPPVLKVPLPQAQAQLANFIAAGHRLKVEAANIRDLAALARRASQWNEHTRRWLDENLGGQAADEYAAICANWDTEAWDPAAFLSASSRAVRCAKDIMRETIVLESIAERLPQWLPPDEVASVAPSLAAAPDPVTELPAAGTSVQPSGQRESPTVDPRAVMVIYGHDLEANNALFDWLRTIGLKPLEFNQLVQATGTATPYTGDAVRKAFDVAQAVIAFFTPDERVRERLSLSERSHGWRLQARPNVLIEAGMALITHPDRTVLVLLGPQELPSDLAGRHYIRLDHDDAGPLHDLATRLHRVAGCDTDLTGTSWLDPHLFPDRSKVSAAPPAS